MFSRVSVAFAVFIGSVTLSPALAMDWEVSLDRNLGAPGYLPYAGEVEGSFTYTYAADLYDVRTNNPSSFPQSYDRSENTFLPSLSYGITDDIAISANLGWGNSRNREDYSFTEEIYKPGKYVSTPGLFHVVTPGTFVAVQRKATASFHALGADDPSFGVTWRAIDQRFAPVDVDITASYAPDIFKSRSPEQNENGSFATGGQSGSIELSVMREMRALTLRAYGSFSYEGRRNEAADDGPLDLRSGAHPSYGAGVQSELRLLPWLAVNAGAEAQQAMRYDRPQLDAFGTTPVTIKPSGVLSPYAGIVAQILPQRIATEFLYQHDFVNDETHLYPYQDDRYYKQESNQFIARMLFTLGGRPAPLPVPAPPTVPIVDSQAPSTYLVFFDWDRADLSLRARQIVAEAAAASTRIHTTRIDIDGYTDLSGTAAYNQKLSVRRAESVAVELVRDGVDRGEISLRGFGETHPLVPTGDGVREPQNRRVEIILH